MMKSLLRSRQAQALLPGVMATYLSAALRTTRWTLEGQAHFLPDAAAGPTIFAFWHECLPLIPVLTNIARRHPAYRPSPIHTLVSQHRDGRFIGAVVRRFGIQAILGSSSRGGSAALRNLLAVLAKGEVIGITPDGPRGPPRQAAAGVAHLAALSGVPVVPCAARSSRRIRLNTWDRMPIPLPFGRGVVVFGPAIRVARENWKDSLPVITAALNHATDQAEQLCSA